jgi:hypothetical protein
MTKSEINVLNSKRAKFKQVRDELNELEKRYTDEVLTPKLNSMVGTYWKYRNCYYAPKKASDYWWLYVRVDYVKGGTLYGTKFQVDKDGKMTVDIDEYIATTFDVDMIHGYVATTADDWTNGLKQIKKIIDRL